MLEKGLVLARPLTAQVTPVSIDTSIVTPGEAGNTMEMEFK